MRCAKKPSHSTKASSARGIGPTLTYAVSIYNRSLSHALNRFCFIGDSDNILLHLEPQRMVILVGALMRRMRTFQTSCHNMPSSNDHSFETWQADKQQNPHCWAIYKTSFGIQRVRNKSAWSCAPSPVIVCFEWGFTQGQQIFLNPSWPYAELVCCSAQGICLSVKHDVQRKRTKANYICCYWWTLVKAVHESVAFYCRSSVYSSHDN